MIQNIATHPGTGLDIVFQIADALHLNLEVINSLRDLNNCTPDALLLLGGSDISPMLYGELNTHSRNTDRDRDKIEWIMVKRAMEQGIPIMGICRGCQMIAAAFGGSLYQDIHKQGAARRHVGPHLVNTWGRLAEFMPTDTVNSHHHQAIRRLPIGFKAAARSHDNIIEAIYRPGVLGVQWHPELLFPNNPGWIGLFEWFASGLN